MDIFSASVTHADDVLFQEVSGETVLLDLVSERYFGLDSIGGRIWELIGTHGKVELIFDAMVDEYDVDEPALRQDLEEHLLELHKNRLIQIVDSGT